MDQRLLHVVGAQHDDQRAVTRLHQRRQHLLVTTRGEMIERTTVTDEATFREILAQRVTG